ncbi:MAG: helix-turn-helix domain-containing protein [Zoogloeaceae bacterium]|jgi:cytoskeleton protein RodZ|nr:helix-turn-helix domain-containing protein [Zoogloeaceae bacterium]
MSETSTPKDGKAANAVADAAAETPTGLQHVREALQSKLAEQLEQNPAADSQSADMLSADMLSADMQSANPPAAEVRVGRQLKAAREAVKLTVPDVAQRLRLGERQVTALEEGDLAALPGRTFVRGFVRNYARVVNLEAAPLLETLDGVDKLSAPRLNLPESTHVVMPGSQEQGRRDSTRVVATGLVLLLIAILLYFFLPEQTWMRIRDGQWLENRQTEENGAQLVDNPVLVPGESLPVSISPAPDAAEDAPVAAEVAPSASTPPAAPPAGGDAQFSFTQESWVEVRDRNNVVISSRQHAAGTRHAVSGAAPLTVTVGRASGVTLTYRGKPVPLRPGAGNDVARVVLP